MRKTLVCIGFFVGDIQHKDIQHKDIQHKDIQH